MQLVVDNLPQDDGDPIELIFDHWKLLHSNGRSRLDDKRRKSIKARLNDGYSPEDLKDAVSGCYLSAFHQGDNERDRKFNDISLICRDAEHIDHFIDLFEKGQEALKKSNRVVPQIDIAKASPDIARRALDQIRRLLK